MRVSLSSQLLRRDVKRARDMMRLGASELGDLNWYALREGRFRPVSEAETDEDDVVLVTRASESSPRDWQRLLRDVLRVPGYVIADRESVGALLFIRPADHELGAVVYTFGSGHHLVAREALDPRFGLLAVLNQMATIDEAGPRNAQHGVTGASVDARAGALQRATLDSRVATTAGQLGRIDTLSDNLRSVRAVDGRSGFGRVEGGRTLRQVRPVESIVDLIDYAVDDATMAGRDEYKQDHGWIDRIVPVADADEWDRVLGDLWSRVQDGGDPQPEILWHALPNHDEHPIDYWLFAGERNVLTVAKNKILSWWGVRGRLVNDGDGGNYRLLDKRIRFFDDGDEEVASSRVIELLAFEWQVDGVHYVLAEGDLFRVAGDLIENVNQDMVKWIRDTRLPRYQGQQEGAYNCSVMEASGWRSRAVVVDGHFLRVSGQTPVEACDILTDAGEFIHVKRKARSSTLSHLWEQAFVSAQLLRRSSEARDQLCEHVLDLCDDEGLVERVWQRVEALERSDHASACVFALVGAWQRADPSSLPFFSRIALRDACMRVQDLGFEPRIEFVFGP